MCVRRLEQQEIQLSSARVLGLSSSNSQDSFLEIRPYCLVPECISYTLNQCCSKFNVPLRATWMAHSDGLLSPILRVWEWGLTICLSQILSCCRCWFGKHTWRTAVLNQHFSNFNVHGDPLEILLKSRSVVGPDNLHIDRLPGDADALQVRTTL